MLVCLYRGNAALAVLVCVDPLSYSLFSREPCRPFSSCLLHHCQSRDSDWLLPVHYAEYGTQTPCLFARNTDESQTITQFLALCSVLYRGESAPYQGFEIKVANAGVCVWHVWRTQVWGELLECQPPMKKLA